MTYMFVIYVLIKNIFLKYHAFIDVSPKVQYIDTMYFGVVISSTKLFSHMHGHVHGEEATISRKLELHCLWCVVSRTLFAKGLH